jgi:hypothetical protein
MTDLHQDPELTTPVTTPVVSGQHRLDHLVTEGAALQQALRDAGTPQPRKPEPQHALAQLVIQDRINKILADDEDHGYDHEGPALLIATSAVYAYASLAHATADYRARRQMGLNSGLAMIGFVPPDAWTRIAEDLTAYGYTVEDRQG